MTADVELLPCPCGAAAAIHNTGVSAGPKEKLVVACVDPECHWSMTGYGAKQAATRWNRRATAAKDAEIEALREDAERYRCLRAQNVIAVTSHDQSVEYQRDDLDAEVDRIRRDQ